MAQELISGSKSITFKNSAGNQQEMYLITTVSGVKIWCMKNQFDPTAETVTYEFQKAGSKYTDKLGVEHKLKTDRYEYQGCGKQIVKKFDLLTLFTELHKIGITPALNA